MWQYAPGDIACFRKTIGVLNYNSFMMRGEQGRDDTIVAELKNGRLAMIGIASLYAATVVKGSVPFLTLG
eukprot:3272003-Prymnesium_polylepis.1